MKHLMVTSIILLAGVSGEAMAGCAANTKVTGSALSTLFTGSTVCATRGTEKWQEQHRSGGTLWDYKKGPTDKVDPSKQVGTWSIAANNITHSYTGGASYTYSIHGPNGGPYSFCTGSTEVVSGASITGGLTSCP